MSDQHLQQQQLQQQLPRLSSRGARELTVGKVASLGRVLSAVELGQSVVVNKKKFPSLRTTYSRLDKPSPDDATLLPGSCRTLRSSLTK